MKLFNVVALGRFLEGNSVDVAVQAYAKFYNEISFKYQKRTSLTLIDKRYNQGLNAELVEGSGIHDKVIHLTLQQQKEIEDTYRSGSVLLLPRISNSISIIKESFLFGLPITCYANTRHSNLLDNSNSMTFDYENDSHAIDVFSNNLELLSYDPQAVSFLKKGAYAKYQNDLSWGNRQQTEVA